MTNWARTEQHLEVQQGNPISPSWLRFVIFSFGYLVFTAVFTSSMPHSNCPQMFFNRKPTWSQDFHMLITSVTVYILVRLTTQQHRKVYTEYRYGCLKIPQYKIYKSWFSSKIDRHGVIIMAQTFWACTHGVSDSGEQSAMGSDSCVYQHI